MPEPGIGEDAFSEVIITGPERRIDIRSALIGAGYERTIDGASSVRLEIADGDRKIMRDPTLFRPPVTLQLGDLKFVMVARSQAERSLNVEFEDAISIALREQDAEDAVTGGTQTRSQFATRLISKAGIAYTVQPDPDSDKVQFAQDGGEEDEAENSWEALERLARDATDDTGDVWRRFSTGREVFFASEAWLMEQYEPVGISEGKGGVRRVEWNIDGGKADQRATVRLNAGQWNVPPGHPVRLWNQGPASGYWIVESVSKTNMFRIETEIGMIRANQAGD